MIKALIFDFDGLILDTEVTVYETWRSLFAEAGHDLPLSEWVVCVGTGEAAYDPCGRLAELTGRPVDREATERRAREDSRRAADRLETLPGVRELLDRAAERGVPVAVASSSPREWVAGHLRRLDLAERFSCVRTREDVARTKPAPDLFLAALGAFGLAPGEAVVLEDSLNGLKAARAAGIPCVAVPNRITRGLDLSGADAIVDSLLDFDARWFDAGVARKGRS